MSKIIMAILLVTVTALSGCATKAIPLRQDQIEGVNGQDVRVKASDEKLPRE